MKVFISQPMRGRSDKEILEKRIRVIEILESMYDTDIDIIDSFFQSAPHDSKPLWFLGKSIELLSKADLAYFCEGWHNARGCRIEYNCCINYDVPYILEK